MRQVYALLGLVKKWDPERVEAACARALDAEAALSAGLIGRMILRATESDEAPAAASAAVAAGRFARDPGHFASAGPHRPHPGAIGDPEPASTGLSEGGSRTEGPAA